MGVASGYGEQEESVASGSGWNVWVWLVGVVVRRYIDFLILLIPIPLVSVLFCSSIPTFCSYLKMFFFIFVPVLFVIASEASFLVSSMADFLYNYISVSGRTSCRKCSKCFYMYLNFFFGFFCLFFFGYIIK